MRHRLRALQQLLRHGVVDSVVAVLEVLLREGIVGVAGFLVSVRAFLPPLAFSFHPEGADVRPVPLVVGRRARQLLQQLRLVAEGNVVKINTASNKSNNLNTWVASPMRLLVQLTQTQPGRYPHSGNFVK